VQVRGEDPGDAALVQVLQQCPGERTAVLRTRALAYTNSELFSTELDAVLFSHNQHRDSQTTVYLVASKWTMANICALTWHNQIPQHLPSSSSMTRERCVQSRIITRTSSISSANALLASEGTS
jgi:hypothetical protein